jgi:tetratricopeptide (TPR) repeat protein
VDSKSLIAKTESKTLCSRVFAFVFLLWPFCFGSSPVFAENNSAAKHYQTGLTYERLGRYEEAYTELQLAYALDQQNAQVALALGIVASRLGRMDVALRALEHSIAVDSNSVASYYHLALIYEKNGAKDRALDAWHRFLSLSQDELLKNVARKHIQYLGQP